MEKQGNTKLDAEIRVAEAIIAKKENELVSLKGNLQGMLRARELIQPEAITLKAATPEEKVQMQRSGIKVKTGNPPVSEMILQALNDSARRLSYGEICKKVQENAQNPVSIKTISSSLNSLKNNGKIDHTADGYKL